MRERFKEIAEPSPFDEPALRLSEHWNKFEILNDQKDKKIREALAQTAKLAMSDLDYVLMGEQAIERIEPELMPLLLSIKKDLDDIMHWHIAWTPAHQKDDIEPERRSGWIIDTRTGVDPMRPGEINSLIVVDSGEMGRASGWGVFIWNMVDIELTPPALEI